MQITKTYTMDVETAAGVKQHPYHLGTQFALAEQFVLDKLRETPAVRSIALRFGTKLVGIYDWRSCAA